MAFARHNIEKQRLIELVRLNPILWDCRLPHYKRSDKKKAIKWNELGRIFNVSGERVQRTFTSLREIFRRELNHEKLLGSRFKSKWEYYEAMGFLKEVIRERKTRERAKPGESPHQSQSQQHTNSNSNVIDEYQYFAPNDPNNPSNQQQQLQHQQLQQMIQQVVALPNLQAPLLQQQPQQQQQQQQQLVQPELMANLNSNPTSVTGGSVLQKALCSPAIAMSNGITQLQQIQQQTTQKRSPSIARERQLSITHSTRSETSSPSIYIKDEPDSRDETISLATTLQNEKSSRNTNALKLRNSNAVKSNTDQTRKHLTSNGNNNSSAKDSQEGPSNQPVNLVIDDDVVDADIDDDLDPDPDVDLSTVGNGRLSSSSTVTLIKPHRPTAREIMNTKFGEFLAARLNALHETVANELMNRILLLIVEK